MRELEEKYIDLILKRCLNFKTGNSLLIYVDLKEHLEFAERVKIKAQEMGVEDIVITCNDLDEIHEYLMNTSLEDISLQPCFDRSIWDTYAKKGSAMLFLGSLVPGLMDDVAADKINKMAKLRNETRIYYRENVGKYTFPWCIANLPNERWAEKIFPSDKNAYDKLFLNFMKMCMVDKDDPVRAWEDYIKQNNYYKNKLNELEITGLHYRNSLGTDLYVEKPKDNIWINLDKTDALGNQMIANMPSYEIFTSPDWRKTNGIVYSSRPLVYNGAIIDKFFIRFRDGKVVECGAEEGNDALQSLVFDNDNADKLGEIALVPNDSPISNTGLVFYETMYDENASCHLALGGGFPKCFSGDLTDSELADRGLNFSICHTDFMIGTSDLEIEADTNQGKKLIFKNGNFNI